MRRWLRGCSTLPKSIQAILLVLTGTLHHHTSFNGSVLEDSHDRLRGFMLNPPWGVCALFIQSRLAARLRDMNAIPVAESDATRRSLWRTRPCCHTCRPCMLGRFHVGQVARLADEGTSCIVLSKCPAGCTSIREAGIVSNGEPHFGFWIPHAPGPRMPRALSATSWNSAQP